MSLYPQASLHKKYLSSDFQFGGRVQTLMVLSSDTDTNLPWSSVILTENITPYVNEIVIIIIPWWILKKILQCSPQAFRRLSPADPFNVVCSRCGQNALQWSQDHTLPLYLSNNIIVRTLYCYSKCITCHTSCPIRQSRTITFSDGSDWSENFHNRIWLNTVPEATMSSSTSSLRSRAE